MAAAHKVELNADFDIEHEDNAKAQEYKNLGNEKFRRNNFKGAITDYKKGLRHDMNNPELHTNISAAYLHLEKYVEAEEHAVYAISLRPNFHKGYMRAAKADHGKGLTKLALKRIIQGLANVTDVNGLKELNKLKLQYTRYLALQSNDERELDFDSDTYQSEDEDDEGLSTDDDSGDDDYKPPLTVKKSERQPPVLEAPIAQPVPSVPPASSIPPGLSVKPPSSQSVPSIQQAPSIPSGSSVKPPSSQTAPPINQVKSTPVRQVKPTPPVSKVQPVKMETSVQLSSSVDPVSSTKTDKPGTTVPLTRSDTSVTSVLSTRLAPPTDLPEDSLRLEDSEKPTEPSNKKTYVNTQNDNLMIRSKTDEDATNYKMTEDGEYVKDDHKLSTDLKYPEKSDEPKSFPDKNDKKDAPDNSGDKTEHPLDRLRELARSTEMRKNIADFKENLKVGGQAYLSGNYRKAADNYKAAYERVGMRYFDFETDERQCNVIRYASYAAMINLNTYDDIVKSIHGLNDMTQFSYDFPAIYIQIARAYYNLNRFKTALEPLEKVQAIIDNIPIFPTFIWPGTNETIEETTPSGLKNAIKELSQKCRMSHKPTAVCRYDNCLKTTNHIVPSELIFSNDPDFNGYVRMMCEEKCHIEFHVSCWKSFKESVCGIGKICDKDFLGRPCLTTDCINSEGTDSSIITSIEIIGPDSQIKSVNKFDLKANFEQKAAEKKARKKKVKSDDKENKEKVFKSKKNRENKLKTKDKKQVSVMQDDGNDEEEFEDSVLKTHKNCPDHEELLEIRKQSLMQLRTYEFGISNWDPRKLFFGNPKESLKASENKFLNDDYDTKDVKDIKDYVFSYFMTILNDEGPLKMKDVEEHWKENAGDIFDIKSVLPNLSSVCTLLLESYRFVQIEDYLCLADHLDESYKYVKDETSEMVEMLFSGLGAIPATCETDSQHTDSVKDGGSWSGEESDDDSSSDSEYSEDDGSDDDDMGDENNLTYTQASSELPPTEPLVPDNVPKVPLEEVMKEMTRFLKDNKLFGGVESLSSNPENVDSKESFETALGGSDNTIYENEKMSSPSNNTDEDEKMSPSFEICIECDESNISDYVELDASVDPGNTDQPQPDVQPTEPVEIQEPFESTECDKGSQSEVETENRHIQTALLKTTDRLSQTKDSDLFKEWNNKVQDLTNQLASANKENARLTKEVVSEKQIRKAQHDSIQRLKDENVRTKNALQESMKTELLKKDQEYKKKEGELAKQYNNMKDLYTSVLQENGQLKKENAVLKKDAADVKQSLTAALANIKVFEANSKSLEASMNCRLQKALQAQLNLLKTSWENQQNLHKMRCIESINSMKNWFSIVCSSGEVESLPSYPLIQQNIMHWMEMAKQLTQLDSDFQEKYIEIARKLDQFNIDMDDLKPDLVPSIPKEPSVPPLDKIHKEITDKHQKTIADLTQLVANQQLQIEKSKEQVEQLTQMFMTTIQSGQIAPPRVQQPITTAFGGLALQYSFPGAVPPHPQYQGNAISSPNQDVSMMGNSSKLPDVHALLQESSKMINVPSSIPSFLPPTLQEEAQSVTPPGAAFSYQVPPPQPPALNHVLSMPPPPLGVAHSLFQNSSAPAEQKKDNKIAERSREPTPKPDQKVGSSRESTPAPGTATPEKNKKKKKSKAGEAAAAEARLAAAAGQDYAASGHADDSAREDSSGWNVVLPKSAIPKQTPQPSASLNEGKMKNKKKLLDKLQARFPTIAMKEIEEIVKQVREMNNGSLSGLPFDEIETRVERIVTKRQYLKNTTMGLVKFSEAAWGTVKPHENKPWSNLQLEECTICLEPMGNERTKVECNHEFHTKCLRKWLKEKSVCPLCNKFTTMPDEFPAL